MGVSCFGAETPIVVFSRLRRGDERPSSLRSLAQRSPRSELLADVALFRPNATASITAAKLCVLQLTT
jgi:hypothetical protein